jgi:hypothetical protein
MLARAESELARGDAGNALDDFERAAMMLHAPDAEMGLIRAALQDGQYRRALAFCAHTAGEHTDAADAGALYAWLLRAGGQRTLAQRVLDETRGRSPGDAVSAAVVDAFTEVLPVASGVLLDLPHRMAPWAAMRDEQRPVPATARFAGNAVLIGDGSMALVPTAALDRFAGPGVWVRNGLGQTTASTVDRSDASLETRGVALLRLKVPLAPGASRESDRHEPFAGSPGYTVQFAATKDAAWPWLAQGFLGGASRDGGLRRLGFDAPDGAQGAPVLDATGRLVGITLRTADGETVWLPSARWQSIENPDAASNRALATDTPEPRGLLAPDEIYESGLRRALQVLVDDSR